MVSTCARLMEEMSGEDGHKISILVKGVMGLMKGELGQVKEIASQLGKFDMDKITKILDALNKYSGGFNPSNIDVECTVDTLSSEVSPDHIFEMFDVDKSGNIDY